MNEVAVVNEASRGIGRSITLAQVEATGGQGLVIEAGIAHGSDRQRLADETLAAFGRLDLLANNAGMAPQRQVELMAIDEASYDEIMVVNLKGPFFLTQRAAREMIRLQAQGLVEQPKIINIGLFSACTSSTSRGESCLSKAGLGTMTALFADALAEHGIPVYEVRPGVVETDMTGPVKEKYERLIANGLTPIRRL